MGSRTGSVAMEHGDDDIGIFKDHDFVMLGDIHKPQILDTEGRPTCWFDNSAKLLRRWT